MLKKHRKHVSFRAVVGDCMNEDIPFYEIEFPLIFLA